mmetsp:Transcript_19229/g.57121  ORF Transcript_19229/g.57121 Transcript_19229/m.57121 type:complete len:1269 (+) Transcript_19229:282-4088(+)
MAEPVAPERWAERAVILLEGSEGLMARVNRLDRTLRHEERRFKALKEPEWKGIRSKLAKAFPEVPDLKKDAKYESFAARAAETVGELRHGFDLFLDVQAHCAVHLETLRAMLSQSVAWNLAEGRETCRAFTRLFSAHARLVYLLGTLDDRKLVVGLYAAAHAAGRGSAPPGLAPLARRFLPTVDEPFRSMCAFFSEHVGPLAQAVAAQRECVQLACGGSTELLKRGALTMIEDNAALGLPTETPLDARHKGKRHVRMLHGELLECRAACDFVVWATLAAPGLLAEQSGVALAVARAACEDCLVVSVYRDATLNAHSELEALGKWFPPRGYPGRWPKDLKLAKLFKEWSKQATLMSGLYHRERRGYLLGELEIMQGLLTAVPGLAGPKAPLALAGAALARDELLWALRHAPERGAAAYPPKYRVKHYATENFAAADLAALAGAFCDLAGLLKRERARTAKYHVTYLATADATALAASGPGAAAAVEGRPALAALVGGLADRLEALKGTHDEALAAWDRAARDGPYVGGPRCAAGIKASTLATLKHDVRQAHGALSAGALAKDPGVVEWINRAHAAVDHAELADGSLFLEHCDPGALWPHRRYLLLRADAAAKDSADADAPGHLFKTLVECARYARRCWGHPAADQDAAALESDARALAEAALGRTQGALQGCLRAVTGSMEQLAAQVAPVEAAYRLERREAALREAEKRGERPREQPPAGYESLPRNQKAIEPLVRAEVRLVALLAFVRWDFGEGGEGEAELVVGDAKLRPAEYARNAVLQFLDTMVPRAFFADGDKLRRPTDAERSYNSVLGAAQRAAGYFDVDVMDHLYTTLGGPPGWRQESEGVAAAERAASDALGSPLAVRCADAYAAAVRSLPPKTVWCPQHLAWRNTEAPVAKKGAPATPEPSDAEKLLQGGEVDALIRVLGADGARCLDATLSRVAVDEMARIKKYLVLKPAQPAFNEVRTGAISGKWLPAAMQLKAEGVLDPLLGACVRLGNVLVLRTLVREALAKASRARAPHLLNAALLQMDRVDGSVAAAAAPPWLLPPPRTKRDPTYHPPTKDEDSPLFRALHADTAFGPDPYERDGNLYREAQGVVESPEDFKNLPWALAAALVCDAWKPARWIPDLNAMSPGLHVVSHALRALAHVSSGPLESRESAKRAQQTVADFVKTAAAIVTHMRLNERAPDFADLPLRAQCAFIEAVAVDANLPRSYLEQHLPYAVIHSALMDIAMDRQTYNEERARPFCPTVFDKVAPIKKAEEGAAEK